MSLTVLSQPLISLCATWEKPLISLYVRLEKPLISLWSSRETSDQPLFVLRNLWSVSVCLEKPLISLCVRLEKPLISLCVRLEKPMISLCVRLGETSDQYRSVLRNLWSISVLLKILEVALYGAKSEQWAATIHIFQFNITKPILDSKKWWGY